MALAATTLANLPPGRHRDRNSSNLYFQVRESKDRYGQPTGKLNRSWIFKFTHAGRSREMGLGPYPTVSLQKAREFARQAREQVKGADRIDPIEARRKRMDAARVETAKRVTFRQCALQYIAAKEREWQNTKHRGQWHSTLERFVFPTLGSLPVGDIDTGLVVKVLEPIWLTRTETAARVRARIELVLGYATASGYRHGDNPARWKGHLKAILPQPTKVTKVRRQPALPYADLPNFYASLTKYESVGAKALRFVILTVCRSGDVVGNARDGKPGARWDQIDWAARVWTIPSTKTGDEHRIPLSDPAFELLQEMERIRQNEFIFPGLQGGISSDSLRRVLPAVGDWRDKNDRCASVHGFRSSFSDWVAECTNHPREIWEAALAHKIANDVERAYQRGDLLEKRRRLMAAWGSYCMTPSSSKTGVVVPMHVAP